MTRLSAATVERLRACATWPELPAGRYVVVDLIARGGMGAVYRAHDGLLHRDVAIKVSNAIRPATLLDDQIGVEARVLASLEHPGIVPVHDAGVLEDGRVFSVMKLVQGETLAARGASLTHEATRLAIVERLVDAVAFAHNAGVVHRDLKPSNVMIGRFGEVLVLDWGVATRIDAVGAEGLDGVLVGTPAFMAPEQAARVPAIGPTADVYSLGALMFWLLTGVVPDRDVHAARAHLRRVSPRLSRRLVAVVMRCLAPEPAQRYASAGELSADLGRYRQGVPVEAHREHLVERVGRWFYTYRFFVLIVVAYLLMRGAFALWISRH